MEIATEMETTKTKIKITKIKNRPFNGLFKF
jgi:hypothetical protein